jgi:hypothetical protein
MTEMKATQCASSTPHITSQHPHEQAFIRRNRLYLSNKLPNYITYVLVNIIVTAMLSTVYQRRVDVRQSAESYSCNGLN